MFPFNIGSKQNIILYNILLLILYFIITMQFSLHVKYNLIA